MRRRRSTKPSPSWPRSRRRTGACWPAARAWCRSWRSGWRGRRISSTSMGRRAYAACGRGRPALHRRLRPPRRLPSSGRGRAARQAAVDGGPPHRALSIRTRGTFCGSVAHADPASEWCTVAVALGAEMVARSTRGTRIIPAHEFFAGHHDDDLERGRAADRDTAAAAAARHPVRFLRVQPPRRRFRHRDGARDLSRQRRQDHRAAHRDRRRRAQSSADRGGRAGVGRQTAAPRASPPRPTRAAAVVDPMEDAVTSAEYRRDLVRTVTRRA